MNTRIAGKRGKLSPEEPRTGSLSKYVRSVLPLSPQSFDNGFRIAEYPMCANDQYGLSPLAAAVHLMQLAYAEIGEEFECPGDAEIISTYFDLTGDEDNGLSIQEVLEAWMEDDLFGTQIVGFVPVDIRNEKEMSAACNTFGALILGAEMPSSAEQQFEFNEPWHVTERNHEPVGGHAFIATGANRFGMDIVTWGDRDGMTWSWWREYGSEAWVVIPEVFVEANHNSIWGIDIVSLQKDLKD